LMSIRNVGLVLIVSEWDVPILVVSIPKVIIWNVKLLRSHCTLGASFCIVVEIVIVVTSHFL
jgi:hypothetical protein